MTRALVPVAEGSEEMETVILVDTLRRAGWEVTLAGQQPGAVQASRGVRLLPDCAWQELSADATGEWDVLAIPGGTGGAERLAADARVLDAVRRFQAAGKLVGAVCAGPLVLQAAGILSGRKATCHPSVVKDLTEARHVDDLVVVDGNIVTSQGPGTTFRFALTLIALREGEARAREIAAPMLVSFP